MDISAGRFAVKRWKPARRTLRAGRDAVIRRHCGMTRTH
eukprot:gene16474-6960_t